MIDIILKALWLQSTKWEDLKPVLSHNIHITDNILSKTQGTKNKYIENTKWKQQQPASLDNLAKINMQTIMPRKKIGKTPPIVWINLKDQINQPQVFIRTREEFRPSSQYKMLVSNPRQYL